MPPEGSAVCIYRGQKGGRTLATNTANARIPCLQTRAGFAALGREGHQGRQVRVGALRRRGDLFQPGQALADFDRLCQNLPEVLHWVREGRPNVPPEL